MPTLENTKDKKGNDVWVVKFHGSSWSFSSEETAKQWLKINFNVKE